MKIYFALEMLTAFILLFLFCLYFVETRIMGSLIIATGDTIALFALIYYKFFKNYEKKRDRKFGASPATVRLNY